MSKIEKGNDLPNYNRPNKGLTESPTCYYQKNSITKIKRPIRDATINFVAIQMSFGTRTRVQRDAVTWHTFGVPQLDRRAIC